MEQKLIPPEKEIPSNNQLINPIPEVYDAPTIMRAIIGGILAAAIGGFIWAWIVILTNYEVGYMAVGLGLLSGYFVLLFSSKQKKLLFQIIAVISSVLGIFAAKYYIFYYFVRQNVAKDYGLTASQSISLISMDTLKMFIEYLGNLLSGYDILWIILAIITAREIVKTGKINLKNKTNQQNAEILKDPGTHKLIKKVLIIFGLLFVVMFIILFLIFRNFPTHT
ncbi:MAG: hypothetical protein NTX82_03110 [Candidatus Parcubacteria bacterium]|nr:hypothetical protein [Candidatus Parcubacteria bacterium]